MKTLLLGTLVTSLTANLFAQGTSKLNNVGTGTAVSNILTGLPLSGTTFKAALYYAPEGVTDEASFIVLNPPTQAFLPTGQFAAGTRSTPATTPPAGTAVFQFRAWEVAFGTSYEQAFMNTNTIGGRFALTGKSDMVRVSTGNGSTIAPGGLVASPAPGFGGVRGFYVTTNNHGPLIILLQPQYREFHLGAATLFSITAEGIPPLHYQWRLNGTEVAGATNASYFLSNVQPAHIGSYDVVVRNNSSSRTSLVATLDVTNVALVVNINGNGTVTRVPNRTTFPANALVTLTASVYPDSAFFNWTGDASGNANPLTLTLDTSKTVTANFRPPTLRLLSNTGTITKAPDKSFYQVGEQVTLTVIPERYYVFTQWGDGDTNNPRVITISANAADNFYIADTWPAQPLETVNYGGVRRTAPVGMPAIFLDGQFVVWSPVVYHGPVTVSLLTTFPEGRLRYTLDRGPAGSVTAVYRGPFLLSESATLRATATDRTFSQSIEADPIDVVILPTLQTSTPGGGRVTVSETPLDLPTVFATADAGWKFLQWLGDATSSSPAQSLRMTRDKCVQAIFGTTVGLVESEGGALLVDPVVEHYPYGSQVRLIAVPRSGYYFVQWEGAASGTNSSLDFVVTNAQPVVSARFAQLGVAQSALGIVPLGHGRVTTTPGANRYDSGSTVTLNAIPEPGEIFLGWNGDAGGTGPSVEVTLEQTRWISASFTRRPRLAISECPGPVNDGALRLILTGDTGRFVLEASSDLANWMPLATLTNLFGTVQFDDPLTPNNPRRFYRVNSVP